LAEHVEPLRNGFAVTVTSVAYFMNIDGAGKVRATAELSIAVSHFGQLIKTVESGAVRFEPSNNKKAYSSAFPVSIGNQKLQVGFAGTSVSRKRDGWGWLPKYMYMKLEPTK